MCTVLVIQQMLTKCAQAHDNSLEILPHIILYLSNYWVSRSRKELFFGIPYFQEFCLRRQRIVFQKSTKNHQQKFAGPRLAPIPYGAAPLPPTKVGAKCLSAVVLDNQDRALSLKACISALFYGLNPSNPLRGFRLTTDDLFSINHIFYFEILFLAFDQIFCVSTKYIFGCSVGLNSNNCSITRGFFKFD